MNRSQYIDAFNEINFTPHLELKVWDNILSDSSLTSQPKIKKAHIFIYSLIATCLCIICIIFGMSLSAPKLTCDLLSNESINTLHGIKDIKKVHIEAKNKKIIVNSQEINNSEMIIFDNNEPLKAGENINFEGKLLGDGIICEFGYILNGSYKKINEVTFNDIGVAFIAPETGTYYWCFINYSDKAVKLSGSISIISNDLVYRNYGDDVIKADIISSAWKAF